MRFKSPAPYARPAQAVDQPPLDTGRPRLAYPPAYYAAMMATSDADILARASQTEPPVKAAGAAE